MNQTIRTHIELDGVILTPEAIEFLRNLQENSNEMLNETRNNVADAVCSIARNLDNYSRESDFQKIKDLLTDLSIIRDNLNFLRKP